MSSTRTSQQPLDPLRAQSSRSSPALEVRQSDTRSPSPSRRRRSGSATIRIPHKVEDETPPQALFHQREVQQALNNARIVPGRLAQVLSGSVLHQEQGSSIQALYQQAVRLSTFQPPSSRIVGLVGDSGVGKSSLINSLLDKRDLARASNSGAACTCVVTEYHFHDRDDFVVHIDFFTREDLRRQFEELLRAFREHESSHGVEMTVEEREDLRRRSDLANNTFSASFTNRLMERPTMLLRAPFEEAISTMLTWTTEILSRSGREHDAQRQEVFDDISQCSIRLKELTSETGDRGQTSLWPFIRKLKVYLKSHILSRGLIIADLPGLRDLNSARQNVTERYVRQCHQIFAVTRIGRATTDVGVKEVFELARRASLVHVGVICTQSDDIRADEAKDDFRSERNRIVSKQRDIARDSQRIRELREEINDFGDVDGLSIDEGQELLEIQQELRDVELQKLIINIRNRKVSRDLRVRYESYPGGDDLKIFCISNTIYWDIREEPAAKAEPFLNLCGILDLRRYCTGIVADSHLRAATEYIKDDIPAFIGSVELWVQAGSGNASAERKQQILEVVSAAQNELDQVGSLIALTKDVLMIIYRQRAQQWSVDAGQASMDWNSFHHSSYSAFCRNYGTHFTNAIGYRCWNEEAIASMKNDMSGLWNTFNGDVEFYLDRTQTSINDIFRTVLRATSNPGNAHLLTHVQAALRTLTATLRHRKFLLLHAIQNITEDFQRKMSILQTDAFAPIRTSIVGQLMETAYHSANMEYGSGSDRRRKTIITSGFRSPNLFYDHRRQFQEKFREISDELQESVGEVIDQQLAFIEADLDTLRDENVVLESERNPEFRRTLGTEVERVREEMRRVARTIDDVVSTAREDTPMEGSET
ncbi:hypothetical protein CC78DRAFT_459505 [Lojkania enalia]|uniref:Uncharacterized protein n=1 Tax=Lojkania enalia TaxID=147567 RepID=A0A9P4KD27_9PLEO|nr:hypothetical protein CC78DRAFT_459505 [Didymosphaeria enalia]